MSAFEQKTRPCSVLTFRPKTALGTTMSCYRRFFILTRTLLWAVAFIAPPLFAAPGQPGTLDVNFGTGGISVTPTSSADRVDGMVIQPDGKLLLVGTCANTSSNLRLFCALRYNTDGTLDNNFGVGGKSVVGTTDSLFGGPAIQADGKLVQVGGCVGAIDRDFCIVRYNTNGSLDTGFGTAGRVVTPVSNGNDFARSVAAQADGKLIVVGECFNGTNTDLCAARYHTNGALDTSFGGGGKVITPLCAGASQARDVAVQANGQLIVVGEGCNDSFVAVRYDPNGTLDRSFGSNGVAFTQLDTVRSSAGSVAIQPDGKLLLFGNCYDGALNKICALRYQADGTLDVRFGIAGKVLISAGARNSYTTQIAIQPDGKIVIAAQCENTNSQYRFCALRRNNNGTVDATFGIGGETITALRTERNIATGLAIQPDGKIVLAGMCSDTSNSDDFCALRYDGGPFGYKACTLDIDGDGSVRPTIDMLIGTRVALGITGNAVVGGINFSPTATRNTWPLIREYLVTQCGMTLVQ
jgi:uncharacterized delta-60 repeat protein